METSVEQSGPDPIDVAVGARIRARRKVQGHSQTHVAERLGLTFQQIQKYERGVNRVSASKLVQIAALLDTTVAWLVGEEDSDKSAGQGHWDILGETGAVDLLKSFSELKSPRARAALVRLAKAMAEDSDDADDAAA